MERYNKKKRQPVSRRFWKYIQYLPKFIRAPLIRSQFEIEYELPSNIVIKIAETENEIQQAFSIVHDSYVDLGYMDPDSSGLRINKFHLMPHSIIIVAKLDEEVIGTISILPDSALGLPVDQTWDISHLKTNGELVAEISSLTIKKGFRSQRGRLLFPLFKMMFHFCQDILQVNHIVIATTLEVEPFYLDVLLFKPIMKKSGQSHDLVKGNPSACCYLTINKDLAVRCKSIYKNYPDKRNIYKFIFVASISNILIPPKRSSIQSYTVNKSSSISRFIDVVGDKLTDKDRLIIHNLDISGLLQMQSSKSSSQLIHSTRKQQRFQVREKAFITTSSGQVMPVTVIESSLSGCQFKCELSDVLNLGDDVVLTILSAKGLITNKFTVKWTKPHRHGIEIKSANADWVDYLEQLQTEFQEAEQNQTATNVIPFKKVS